MTVMQRRDFIMGAAGIGLAVHPLVRVWARRRYPAAAELGDWFLNGPQAPVFIYNNWSAYDELSDNVVQTETLAMRELDEVIRLKRAGVRLDYYVMDAFWFDLWGGYRVWHRKHWPNGPEKWLAVCKTNNILPGMWFSTNLIATHSGRFLEVVPEWKDSLGTDPNIMCLFDGGYLNHLAATLQIWYGRGVRLFKFDFAYFDAVTPAMKDRYSKEEVVEKNKLAFMNMLQSFRRQNPDVLITGYNGFGGDMENTFTPFDKKIDPRWLDTFDTLYCGDPRFSDTPMMNIWRSQDHYSDHQVSAYQAYGMPIRRIDNCAFMIGTTGTCYYRAKHGWKGMLILELARGGWVNVYHGNLELLDAEDAKWFARVQALYRRLQQQDNTATFGEAPGKGKPYGFKSFTAKGEVCTVVNPSQQIAVVELPVANAKGAQILFADGGHRPLLQEGRLALGPEQMAVVGTGEFADFFENRFTLRYDFGLDESIAVPLTIDEVDINFVTVAKNTVEGRVDPVRGKGLRIVLQQLDQKGLPYRSWPGAPPDGKKISEVIRIAAMKNGKPLPLHIEYDKVIWSGLSWGVGEIHATDLEPSTPITIRCSSGETMDLQLKARVYAVTYQV
jgi:hypothetical protein